MSEKGLSKITGEVPGALNSEAEAAPVVSWPYVALNSQTVGEAAYNNYYVGGCMYATGSAIVNALVKAGALNWNTFNPDLFRFGGSGIANWGTLCGSLNSSCAIIQMVTGSSATDFINELLGWYCNNPFPSARFDAIAKYAVNQPTTVSKSPLCRNSSRLWAKTTRNNIDSNNRNDRCAKLAGDVAYKTVEILNAWKAGIFSPTLTSQEYQSDTNFDKFFNYHVVAESE